LTPKGYGQLRDLRKALGDFTPDVLAWMADSVHWSRFCQQVRAESGPGMHRVPPDPHLGFLLKHRNRAMKHLRAELELESPDVVEIPVGW